MSNRLIDIVDITKSYGDSVILDQLNLYIRENEFLTLLGPSGCGKTTLLRILGGFETPDSGKIIFDGKNINDIPPNRRQLNTVFQKYALQFLQQHGSSLPQFFLCFPAFWDRRIFSPQAVPKSFLQFSAFLFYKYFFSSSALSDFSQDRSRSVRPK